MDYCIKNNRNVYIKLNDNGCAVTCAKSQMEKFEFSKAKNILSNLPKTLKKMNFKLEAIPDISSEETEVKIIKKDDYIVPEKILRWIDKFGLCSDILEEARQRETELIKELQTVDNEFLDILHIVELEPSKDLYGGWKEYKRIRENREKRRDIKDELLIVENVLSEINPSCLKRDKVQKAIDGLLGRKYIFRIVEETQEKII